MYDLISGIINHTWTTSSSDQSIIYYICGALIIIFFCVVIDLVYRIFGHLWR